MSKILSLKAVTTKAGKPTIIVITDDGKTNWVPYGSWVGHGYSETLDAYVGGEFHADYFQEGDTLLSGDAVTKSDIILRDFTAAMAPEVTAHIASIAARERADGFKAAAAMFRIKRDAALAAAKKVVVPVSQA